MTKSDTRIAERLTSRHYVQLGGEDESSSKFMVGSLIQRYMELLDEIDILKNDIVMTRGFDIYEIYKLIDTNKTGYIDTNSLGVFLDQYGCKLPQSDLENIIRMVSRSINLSFTDLATHFNTVPVISDTHKNSMTRSRSASLHRKGVPKSSSPNKDGSV